MPLQNETAVTARTICLSQEGLALLSELYVQLKHYANDLTGTRPLTARFLEGVAEVVGKEIQGAYD